MRTHFQQSAALKCPRHCLSRCTRYVQPARDYVDMTNTSPRLVAYTPHCCHRWQARASFSSSLPHTMPASRTSRSVRLVIGSTRSTAKLKSSVLSQTQQVEDRRRRQERYNANIAGKCYFLSTLSIYSHWVIGLSTESQTLLADMQHEAVDRSQHERRRG
jgi:lysine/ornithine N-monooxygenase